MKNKKTVATLAAFALVIFGFALFTLLPDKELSVSERRRLATLPELTADAVFSGSYASDMEEYLLDQFPLREQLRTVSSALKLYAFRQGDNHGVYIFDGSAFKLEYPLDAGQATYAAEKMAAIAAELCGNANVFYSIIPDKNYFAAEAAGRPHMDYDELVSLVRGGVSGMEYIDIMPLLSLEDYYGTDAHWRQESIYEAARALAEQMGALDGFLQRDAYAASSLSPFYGAFGGQSALPLAPDTLTYMTSPLTESAVVTGIELSGERPVYDVERFSGLDGYDVYLSGAQSVLYIDCPAAESDRELVIFRDSFASSIAPYFIGAYSKITLVDLRYISSSLIADYVDFDGSDVLFLYSTSLLNSGRLLK